MQKTTFSTALALSIAVALSGCSGSTEGTQDVGTSGDGSANSRVIAARAIDGYLAGATAYVDLNENGALDAFEPRAITDRDGFFSYNHLTGTDYCASAGNAQHCLRAALASGAELLIRVTGGYDTITGLPFKGTLSLRSSELDSADLRLVTPQTSLTASSTMTAQEKLDALVRAGVLNPSGSLDDDHIDAMLSGEATRAQIATILARILGHATELSHPTSTFEDVDTQAWHTGYAVMAQQLAAHHAAGGSGAFGAVFTSVTSLNESVRHTAFLQQYPNTSMPVTFALPNEAAALPLLQFAAELTEVSEELIAAMQANAAGPTELKAALRALAVASERGLNNPNDPEASDVLAWVRQQLAQGTGLGSDLTALGGNDIDLNALIEESFDFDPTSNSMSAHAVIPADAANAFASITNTAFHVEVNDEDERGAALIFMVGESGANQGELKLCIRYRDDSGDFDTATNNDPNGAMLVNGRWSLLNDYTLTMSADVAGGVRPLVVKSVGVSGSELTYRFDFGSDPSEWTGPAPVGFAPNAVPANDTSCKNALVERFGPAS